jgi:hypothetical protein
VALAPLPQTPYISKTQTHRTPSRRGAICPAAVLEPLCPNKISRTLLFSKPIFLAGGKIVQIGAESQFSPNSVQTNPSATGCYLAGKPRRPSPALISSGEPGARLRPHGHIISRRGNGPAGNKLREKEMDSAVEQRGGGSPPRLGSAPKFSGWPAAGS